MSSKYENEGLYQRHRPKSFDDLIGQEAAVAILESKLSKRPTAFPSAVLLSGPSGCGKCLGRDTPVLKYDGTVTLVQDIRKGDLLMGPDSTPRRVLSVCSGVDELYRVTPVKGDSYVVNSAHILSLKVQRDKAKGHDLVNISVTDYLKKARYWRSRAKGWRTAVDWEDRTVALPPYFVGLWLGDGTMGEPAISKPDREVFQYLSALAESYGMRVVRTNTGNRCPTWRLTMGGKRGIYNSNPITRAMRELGLFDGSRAIPHQYKANSRSVRLELLAGLLDSDGHMHGGGYDFISKHTELANGVAWLCRSLGLAAYVKECEKSCQGGFVGTYHRVSISGDCSVIPMRIERKKADRRRQIKDHLLTGITVDHIGRGDYYGFELDGDHLFMLGDFTVTHNTTATYILKERLQCAEGDWLANNSARERGIDFVRNLERGMLARPSGGKVRICLLDEAHKLTPDAMEALLKSLEEVANTYKFLLCTTDAEKIRKSVGKALFTRLVEVPFVPVDEKRLEGLVTKVATKEGVTLPRGVSVEIAGRAEGSPRQALTLLEAIIDLKDPEQIREVLDATVSSAPGRSLAQLLFDQRGPTWADIAAAIKLVTEAESARRGVLGYADAVALKNPVGSASWTRAMLVLTHFQYNTYDTGRVGLTLAAGKVLQALTAHTGQKKTG